MSFITLDSHFWLKSYVSAIFTLQQPKPHIQTTMVAEKCSDEAANAERQARVKARWGLLRQALLGGGAKDRDTKVGGCTNNTEQHSMHSFPGFQVLDRTILSHDDGAVRVVMNNDTAILSTNECDSDSDAWDIVQYTYTSTNTGHKVQFHTREAATKQHEKSTTIQSRMEALLSHRNYGVDNTGNVRVWDAEGTLGGFLLSLVMDNDDGVKETEEDDEQLLDLKKVLRSTLLTTYSTRQETTMSSCNLLELGSGQAGLCGLAMATASSSDNCNQTDSNKMIMKPLHIVLTDGHPKCVKNNEVCTKLLPQSCKAIVETHMLLWDSSSCKGANACHQINKLVQSASLSSTAKVDTTTDDEGQYHLCVASDCVHFQEFHDGLLTTIARTLAVNGIALLCQPTRGTSLQNFMDLVDAVNDTHSTTATNETSIDGPLFLMTLYEDFHPKVSEMHKSLLFKATDGTNNTTLQCSSSPYDPNWHRPLLLVLQKLRTYNEEIDGEISRRHVKRREA